MKVSLIYYVIVHKSFYKIFFIIEINLGIAHYRYPEYIDFFWKIPLKSIVLNIFKSLFMYRSRKKPPIKIDQHRDAYSITSFFSFFYENVFPEFWRISSYLGKRFDHFFVFPHAENAIEFKKIFFLKRLRFS